jgi:hypothetical protein
VDFDLSVRPVPVSAVGWDWGVHGKFDIVGLTLFDGDIVTITCTIGIFMV